MCLFTDCFDVFDEQKCLECGPQEGSCLYFSWFMTLFIEIVKQNSLWMFKDATLLSNKDLQSL